MKIKEVLNILFPLLEGAGEVLVEVLLGLGARRAFLGGDVSKRLLWQRMVSALSVLTSADSGNPTNLGPATI